MSSITCTGKRHRPSTNRGFTLVEIMIASTILITTIGMILVFLISALDVYGLSVGKLNVNGEVRHFAEALTRDTTRACKVEVSTDGTLLTLTYRDKTGATTGAVTYTFSTAAGTVTRTDVATSVSAVIARGISPQTSGGKLFSPLNSTTSGTNTVHVTGYISSKAQSLQQRIVSNIFEFAATQHG